MEYNNVFKRKTLVLLTGMASMILLSCGSYQSASYDDDGIYEPDTKVVAQNNEYVEAKSANAKYYEEYFGRTVTEYGDVIDEDEEVFTDVESYSSDNNVEQPESRGYSAWEDAGDNVTVNVYNDNWNNWGWNAGWGWNNRWGWNAGWGWNNRWGWNAGWNNWGWNAGWGWNAYCPPVGFYNPYVYYGPGFYNGFYSPYYRRNVAFVNGRRGYYNAYAGRYGNTRYSNRAYTNRSRLSRTNTRSVTPRRTTRVTPRTTPRSTPRSVTPRSTTPRSTPRYNTPRSNPRTVTPRSTPRSTPRYNTPRSSSPRSYSRPSRSSSSRSSFGGSSRSSSRSSRGGRR